MRNVLIASDHAGYQMKNYIYSNLQNSKNPSNNVIDLGPYNSSSVDYPDFAHALVKDLRDGLADVGILLCGSANGMSMTANKYPYVRAAVCWNAEIAQLAREHNQANIICIPARYLTNEQGLEIIETFIKTSTKKTADRHVRRVKKINKIK